MHLRAGYQAVHSWRQVALARGRGRPAAGVEQLLVVQRGRRHYKAPLRAHWRVRGLGGGAPARSRYLLLLQVGAQNKVLRNIVIYLT